MLLRLSVKRIDMHNQIPTFTEFLGTMPKFSDPADSERYLVEKEIEYYKLRMPGIIARIKAGLAYLGGEKLDRLNARSYRKLSDQQKREYKTALLDLNISLCEKSLKKGDFYGRILDFGCGTGGSSILLGLQSDDVTAIDKDPSKIEALKKTGMFPAERAIAGDGFDYILQQPESSYDMITAFGLGCQGTPDEFVEEFHACCKRAIKPQGKIVIVSDLLTMDKARKVFGASQLKYSRYIMVD